MTKLRPSLAALLLVVLIAGCGPATGPRDTGFPDPLDAPEIAISEADLPPIEAEGTGYEALASRVARAPYLGCDALASLDVEIVNAQAWLSDKPETSTNLKALAALSAMRSHVWFYASNAAC